MTPRARLYALLCDEIATGWPDPYWDQDRAAARHRTHGLTLGQEQALDRYIDLITEVAA
jgi:hypothetical protein